MEVELGVLFINCQRGAALRIALNDVVCQQPPKPVVTDSATCDEFVNDNIRQCRSRATYMRLYLVRNRVR